MAIYCKNKEKCKRPQKEGEPHPRPAIVQKEGLECRWCKAGQKHAPKDTAQDLPPTQDPEIDGENKKFTDVGEVIEGAKKHRYTKKELAEIEAREKLAEEAEFLIDAVPTLVNMNRANAELRSILEGTINGESKLIKRLATRAATAKLAGEDPSNEYAEILARIEAGRVLERWRFELRDHSIEDRKPLIEAYQELIPQLLSDAKFTELKGIPADVLGRFRERDRRGDATESSYRAARAVQKELHRLEKIKVTQEGKQKLAQDGGFEVFKLSGLESNPKESFERIGGKDVSHIKTPEELMNAYGFRGIQYGNYVGDAKREKVIRQAAEALSDLSDVLGIPPEAIGLSKQHFYKNKGDEFIHGEAGESTEKGLGLAFGARGHGDALAHYERGEHAINLTRDRGDGSLAHEWLHALDSMGTNGFKTESSNHTEKNSVLNAFINLKKTMASGSSDKNKKDALIQSLKEKQKVLIDSKRKQLEEMRPKGEERKDGVVIARFNAMVRIFNRENDVARTRLAQMEHRNASLFSANSASQDTGYWSETSEMAARAFEGYVARKLKKAGRKSEFLVDSERADPPEDEFMTSVYPQLQEEKDAIDRHFDEIFENIRKVLKKS